MPEIRTRPDGTRYPITPKKGTAGVVVTAAVLAGAMAAAGGGTATESVGAALDSAVDQGANARTSNSQSESQTWQRLAIREIRTFAKNELRCAVQSYGKVQQFFLRTPCNSLSQKLFALGDAQGDIIALSVMWVKMSGSDDAARLKDLEDTYGTGDVTPFATEALQLGGLKFTGRHYASRRDGSLVAIAETEPARGRPSAKLLDDVAAVAVVLPPL